MNLHIEGLALVIIGLVLAIHEDLLLNLKAGHITLIRDRNSRTGLRDGAAAGITRPSRCHTVHSVFHHGEVDARRQASDDFARNSGPIFRHNHCQCCHAVRELNTIKDTVDVGVQINGKGISRSLILFDRAADCLVDRQAAHFESIGNRIFILRHDIFRAIELGDCGIFRSGCGGVFFFHRIDNLLQRGSTVNHDIL